jgi:glycosyltransferase involved in cell wall biosynthesis
MVYNLAQMFVYPSIYEGFGFPPLEAMACGTPVITTGVSAMLDNVGQAGLLTPPQDQPALEQAILRLLHEPRLRDRLSQAGRERAAEFTWARTARLTLHTYRYALSAQ